MSTIQGDKAAQTWGAWFLELGYRGGSKTLSVLESMGGKLTYMFGITTPKYNAEIQEYLRTQEEKKVEDAELKSWTSPNLNTQSTQPEKYELPQEVEKT